MTLGIPRLGTAAVAAAGLLALAACSSSGDGDEEPAARETSSSSAGEATPEAGESSAAPAGVSPQELSDRAEEALRSATSLRMRTLGDPAVTGMGVDLHMDRDGSCQGSVTQSGAGTVDVLVREDDEVWLRPDAVFWQSQLAVTDQALLDLLDGVWLYGHMSDPELGQMAGACSLAALQESTGSGDGPGGPERVGPETDYHGTPVVTLSGTNDDGGAVTMLIATEGEPYPLLVRTEENGTETEIELSRYNEPVTFEVPPAELVVDVADFRAGDIQV
jgi:hypothetical protein